MRCWKTPTGNYLVESPNIRRMTWRDPTPHCEARILLREANVWLAQNGQNDRISNFLRYYEVDQQGIVIKSYEEYSYSYEDDLYSWSYRVISDQLWEYWLTHYFEEHKLKVNALISDLEVAELPEGTMVTG
jgi:hypothetical protein